MPDGGSTHTQSQSVWKYFVDLANLFEVKGFREPTYLFHRLQHRVEGGGSLSRYSTQAVVVEKQHAAEPCKGSSPEGNSGLDRSSRPNERTSLRRQAHGFLCFYQQ